MTTYAPTNAQGLARAAAEAHWRYIAQPAVSHAVTPARNITSPRLDGSYFHGNEKSRDTDIAKSRRLRETGWTVVRIREAPLDLLAPTFDVQVGFLAEPGAAAADILDHLAVLGPQSRSPPPSAQQEVPRSIPRQHSRTADWLRAHGGGLGTVRTAVEDVNRCALSGRRAWMKV